MKNTLINSSPLPSEKWLPLVQELCEHNNASATTIQALAVLASKVEQVYFDLCPYEPSTVEIDITVENVLRTCMPAKSWEAM